MAEACASEEVLTTRARGEARRRSRKPCVEHGAGVVDEDVDAGLGGGDFRGNALHFAEQRQIRIVDVVGRAGSDCTQPLERRFAAFEIARDLHDAGAHGSEGFGGHLSDAGGGAGDDDYFIFHSKI